MLLSNPGIRSTVILMVFWGLGLFTLGLPESACARQPAVTAQTLWETAAAAAAREDWRRAALNFERLHREFPDFPRASEALWQAAQGRKKIAKEDPDPDWDRVRLLFRFYLTDYPNSPRADVAYLEMGKSYFQMRFLREALTHFRLFSQRYPNSPLLPRARYWQARTMAETGAFVQAIALFRELIGEADEQLRFDAMVGLGRTLAISGDHPGAVKAFHDLLRNYPKARFDNPELLLELGLSYLKAGPEQTGREQLFTFINLAPKSPRRPAALFEIGESLHRQGEFEAAGRLYARVLEEGLAEQPEVILARFRQVERLDLIGDFTGDPVDDNLYLKVIDRFAHQAIAQDARYALIQRFKRRNELAAASELAQVYLRRAHPPPNAEPGLNRAGELMVFLVEDLLARGEYQRIYHLQVNEHRHIAAYQPGRLRLLIGQAFEALGLYRQAAALYFQAMTGTLTSDELFKLYWRRVEVYLALNELLAAQRLLDHLRLIYAKQPELVDVYYLLGRLREEEQRYDESLEFFRLALNRPTATLKREDHGRGYLRVLATVNEYGEMLPALVRFQREQWLSPQDLQIWYRRAGDGLRELGHLEPATTAYRAAVAKEMPTQGADYQAANFHLGVLLANQGALDAAQKHLELARAGPDQLLAAMAVKRLNQLVIAEEMARMRTLFEQ